MSKKILVTQSSLPPFDEYVNEIKSIWESHWLTNMGEKHNELENKLQSYLAVPNITLFTNGHLALECALSSFDLKGEVITTPFSFVSTTHAIVRCGLKPVFCDVNPIDFTIDVDKIEELITPNTCAILPVHVYGNVCDVERIQEIADKYNLKVIYDAAHAFGVTWKNLSIGNFGDASMFSFHATKVFNTIEGGAVTYNDAKLKRKLNDLKNFGITGLETVEYIGGNAKMNEFQAAMGLCNLKYIDFEISKRRAVFDRYMDNLGNVDGISLPKICNEVRTNYSYFPILLSSFKKTRDQVYTELLEHGVFSRKYFYPLINDFECYSSEFSSLDTPIAKEVSNQILTLPLFADLNLDEVDLICNIILG